MNPAGTAYCERCEARLSQSVTDSTGEGNALASHIFEASQPGGSATQPDSLGSSESASPENPSTSENDGNRTDSVQAAPADLPSSGGPLDSRGSDVLRHEDLLAWPQAAGDSDANGHVASSSSTNDKAAVDDTAELPEWLREIPAPHGSNRSQAVERQLDGSVKQAPAETSATEPGEPPTTAADDGPDWLRESYTHQEALSPALEPAGTENPPTPVDAARSMADETLAWLNRETPHTADLELTSAFVPEQSPQTSGDDLQQASPADIPDWLRELSVDAAPDAPLSPPLFGDDSAVLGTEDVPSQLSGEWSDEVTGPQQSASVLADSVLGVSSAEQDKRQPEWFTGILPEEVPGRQVGSGQEVVETREPAAIDATLDRPAVPLGQVPAWLRMEQAGDEHQAEEAEQIEQEGPLEGLRGVLPPTETLEPPSAPKKEKPAEPSEASLSRARLWQTLVTREAESPQSKRDVEVPQARERIERLAVSLALLVSTIAALVSPRLADAGQASLLAQTWKPATEQAYGIVAGARPGDEVMVAFEYSLATAEEAEAIAAPVLSHLISRGVQIAAVSTLPEGPELARALLSRIASPDLEGTSFRVAPYRPGGALAAAQLLTAANPAPDLIVLLTTDTTRLRWWAEQKASLFASGEPPMVLVAGAANETLADAYTTGSPGQIDGTVIGLLGGAAYESLVGDTGFATESLDALSLGHAVVAGLIVCGALLFTSSELALRRKK
jgi:hypothetical protein